MTVKHKAQINAGYDAAYYESNGQFGDRPALRMYERLAKRYIQPGKLLDFGCGTGALLKHLARHFDATGLEQSDWARASAAAKGFAVTDNTATIGSHTLSGIISVHVIEHIGDEPLMSILDEWRRILTPNGMVIVVTPDAGGIAAKWKGAGWSALSDPTHINLKTFASWRQFFTDRGFRVLHACADGLWDFPYLYPRMGRAEALLLGWPTLIQFGLARPIVKPGSGEACILIMQADD